jgi:hypothetical protein
MKSRVDQAVVLAEQFVASIAADLAEIIVYIGDDPARVGLGYDRMSVERGSLQIDARQGLGEQLLALMQFFVGCAATSLLPCVPP